MRGTAPRRRNAACARLALSLALAAAGCAKHAAPNQPVAQLPPQVVATSPPARGQHIPTDTAIWVQFDRPLDPSTVDVRHVFLKIDTRRLSITVSYDASTRRVIIDPGGQLALFSTHTVELKPGLKTADGDSLGQTYFWQFTTLSVRRPRAPYPDDGATGESPFAELLWQGTETTAGPILYELFTGADSGAVAARTSALTRLTAAHYLPRARWPQDAPTYWSVRATNQNTGDRSEGPVWRFDPLPASTPVDTVIVPLFRWLHGYPFNLARYVVSCGPRVITVSPNWDNLEHWDFTSLGPGIRLAGSSLVVTSTTRDGDTHGLLIFSVRSVGTLCNPYVTPPSVTPPYEVPTADVPLASARLRPDSRLQLDSDFLSSFAEAAVRHGDLDATLFRSATSVDLFASAAGRTDPNSPALYLYVYRTGPRPAVAARR